LTSANGTRLSAEESASKEAILLANTNYVGDEKEQYAFMYLNPEETKSIEVEEHKLATAFLKQKHISQKIFDKVNEIKEGNKSKSGDNTANCKALLQPAAPGKRADIPAAPQITHPREGGDMSAAPQISPSFEGEPESMSPNKPGVVNVDMLSVSEFSIRGRGRGRESGEVTCVGATTKVSPGPQQPGMVINNITKVD
jgi:hypothetical protein